MSADEFYQVTWQLRRFETLRRVARFAVRPVMRPDRRLVAGRALEAQRLLPLLVAVEALDVGVPAFELDLVLRGSKLRPGLSRYALRSVGFPCEVVPLLACLLAPAATDTPRHAD